MKKNKSPTYLIRLLSLGRCYAVPFVAFGISFPAPGFAQEGGSISKSVNVMGIPPPNAYLELARIGELAAKGRPSDIILDDKFWENFDENHNGYVSIIAPKSRNDAYAGLFFIVNKFCADSSQVSTDKIVKSLSSVLSFGLLSDYVATSGAVQRIKYKFGIECFRDDKWRKLSEKLSSLDLFLDNEALSLIDISPRKEHERSAILALRDVYKTLFKTSKNRSEFDRNESKLNEEMSRKLKSGDRVIADLYFNGPSLQDLAKRLYSNRDIYEFGRANGVRKND